MALPGELAGLNGVDCNCGEHLELEICRSAAGYYLGYWCPNCGPYSKETYYFSTYEEADTELKKVQRGEEIDSQRNTGYRPEADMSSGELPF